MSRFQQELTKQLKITKRTHYGSGGPGCSGGISGFLLGSGSRGRLTLTRLVLSGHPAVVVMG